MTRNSIQRAMAALTAGFLAVAALAYPSLVGFRCEAMETVHDRPCCPHTSLDGGGEPRLARACCALETHAAPLPAPDDRGPETPAPFVAEPSRAAALAWASPGLSPARRDAGPPLGPPLRLRDCSLLI